MMELMVASVVLAIIASLAVVGYGGYRDRVAMMVDETNQEVLAAALKLYAYDNNSLPGSLAEIETRCIDRAYAAVTEGREPYTFFVYLEEKLGVKSAMAEPPMQLSPYSLPPRYYDNRRDILLCPLDAGRGLQTSYAIGQDALSLSISQLLSPHYAHAVVIEEIEPKHHGETRVVTTIEGKHQRRTGSIPPPQDYIVPPPRDL